MAESIDITSANAVCVLTVENLYPSGVTLEQFAADGSFAVETATIAEARMGVDGHLAAGYTPNPRTVSFTFEANSPSLPVLRNIAESSALNRTVYKCQLQITVPSLKKEWKLKNGVMLSVHDIPDGKKVLNAVDCQFTFESCTSSSI